MSDSRFTPQNKTTNVRLSTNTVGLVALSDYRKRRVEVLEQQEREQRETAFSGTSTSTPDRSVTGTPDNAGSDSTNTGASSRLVKKKKKKLQGKKLLSFDDDDGDDDNDGALVVKPNPKAPKPTIDTDDQDSSDTKAKFKANASVGVVPKATTKAALRKDATRREALRREFVAIQDAVKATEIAIPFVFYDGANTPGGTVRVKKGDLAWVFLDKSRKVGAELGVGDKAATAQRTWARVGVDDLMIVRGTVIIPHHYDFYFFVVNKNLGPGGQRLFDYSAEPMKIDSGPASDSPAGFLTVKPDVNTLEGAKDDPTLTKVVDRRWFEKNKHIYPASMWQEFDPEKDYSTEVRRDTGGNTFFFSK